MVAAQARRVGARMTTSVNDATVADHERFHSTVWASCGSVAADISSASGPTRSLLRLRAAGEQPRDDLPKSTLRRERPRAPRTPRAGCPGWSGRGSRPPGRRRAGPWGECASPWGGHRTGCGAPKNPAGVTIDCTIRDASGEVAGVLPSNARRRGLHWTRGRGKPMARDGIAVGRDLPARVGVSRRHAESDRHAGPVPGAGRVSTWMM